MKVALALLGASLMLGSADAVGESTAPSPPQRVTSADGGLTYSFDVEDPQYLKERVSGTAQWLYRPDVEFVATPCSRDNAKRFLSE